MIQVNQRPIGSIYCNGRAIKAVYAGQLLVWTKDTQILYCFSNGYWIDEYPWVDDRNWTD